jgi:hypothetical protein
MENAMHVAHLLEPATPNFPAAEFWFVSVDGRLFLPVNCDPRGNATDAEVERLFRTPVGKTIPMRVHRNFLASRSASFYFK